MIRLGRRKIGTLFIALLVGGSIHSATRGAEEDPLTALDEAAEDIPAWDLSANLKAGAGYKSNVALSNINRESSAFTGVDLDTFLFRAPIHDPWEVNLLVTGEDRRFWQSDTVEKEQMFLTSLDVKRELAERWKLGLNALYLYYDQVFDASVTEGLPLRIQAQYHKLSLGPTARLDLGNKRRLEFRSNGSRNLFDPPLDDYWQADNRILFGQGFGKRSEITFSVELSFRDYDSRRHSTIANGDTLKYRIIDGDVTLRHYWDEQEHWRSRLRAGFGYNDDNGNGFYNYQKWRLGHELSFASGKFEAIMDAKLLHYRYARDVFSGGDRLRRTEVVASVRFEQALTKKLKAFAEITQEWALSSDPFERYKATTAWGGLDWQIR